MSSTLYYSVALKPFLSMETFCFFFLVYLATGVRSDPCFEPRHLIGWLKSNQKEGVSFFCRDEVSVEDISEDESLAFYTQGVKSCISRGHFTGLTWDSDGRPKGHGSLNTEQYKDDNHGDDRFCINVHGNVRYIHSSFVNGYPEGVVRIKLKNHHRLEGRSVKGILHGKTRIYDQNHKLQFLGNFVSGRPKGPAWIYSHDIEKGGVILVHFDERGTFDSSRVVYIEPGLMRGYYGRIVNDTTLLIEQNIILNDSVEENCIHQIKFSYSEKTRHSLILPVILRQNKEEASLTGLTIRSNEIYMYNRVAKTGSQSIIEVLVSLRPRTGVNVKIDQRLTESMMEPYDVVKSYIRNIADEGSPTVFVRHYNFVDFSLYGYGQWNPIYINIVRNPVERVISWFYYQRASWNIIERMEAFPNEPLPDSKFLRKDFASCVLDPNDDECNFIEGTSTLDYPDHRSQMMAFCGHELFCADFNSQKVLQKAKENVDKFFPVVGVLESLNQSLAVFESTFPALFPGALELYHSSQEVKHKKIENNLKPMIPTEIMDILNRNFTREIEFYDFCKQRLQTQYEALQLESKK